eukprot:TRINITY_DN752_c0_g1_i1.p1 TRINITY_DN752_c0_g1~~TRINITY_DN752_c0_g1_i1.p1  ORF type:complete len:210 (-),score=33.99 TRINITY_DN752_c0_g1_i1:241-870(-)
MRQTGRVCPIEIAYKFKPLYVIRNGRDGRPLRDHIASLVHKLFGKYLVIVNKTDENESKQQQVDWNPNIKIISKLTKLSKYLLSNYECQTSDGDVGLRSIEYIVRFHKDALTNEQCTLRPMLVERAVAIHKSRVERNQALTQEVLDLLVDLSEVSVHEYSDLANSGLRGLNDALTVFRRHRRRAIQFALKTLRTQSMHERKSQMQWGLS